MNIDLRKKKVVSEFLKLSNEESIKEVQKLVDKLITKDYKKSLKPKSLEDFNHEINQALEDEEKGHLIKARELKKNIKKWR